MGRRRDGGVALVDPLAVDVTALARLFGSPALAVMHAAQQDIDVLTHTVGSVPARLYDTQLAAGFLGYGTPSLASLVQREVGASPPKGDRLTDWLSRPLTESQRRYAIGDVSYLFELHDRLGAKLADLGRTTWVEEACEELRTRPVSGTTPEQAWLRLKDARSLRPRAAPSPRPLPRGVSAVPPRSISPSATCSPISPCSASRNVNPPRSRSSARREASTVG
ncbi:MAG: ribonuclease D [Ilumatobacteraceae bacterium]